jgi:hypothetical protein
VLAERVLRYRASVVAVARELTAAGQSPSSTDADDDRTPDLAAPSPKVALLRPRRG